MHRFAQLNGWMPEPHTRDQVDEFKAYIEKITKSDSNTRNTYISLNTQLTKKRADEIRRFIENEQALCVLDSNYWETRYAWICNEKSEIFRFTPNKTQQIFNAIIAQFELDEVSIELLVLKARQLGISTATAMKFIHRLWFIPYTRAIMASVKQEKSELLMTMLTVCQERQPFWLIPRMTTDRIKLAKWLNGSILSIQSGSQATGLAQGWTPTLVHISEIGDLPNPKKTLEEGLFRATHSSRKLFAVYEGTGNGNTGWQADKWRDAKEKWPKGQSRLCPVFLNWPLAVDLYPQADWLKKFPVPHDFMERRITEETKKHVRRCELYIRNTPYLARIMGTSYTMPVHQQWYYQFEYEAAAASKTLKTFKSQMPADDLEALQGKHDVIFDPETIEIVTKQRKLEYQDYAIEGMTIDDGFEPDPDSIDYTESRIRVVWDSPRGQHYEWNLIPLKPIHDEDEEKLSLDRIRIWEHPDEVERPANYTFGVDTADGYGLEDEDRACASMTRSEDGMNCDVQVAEFTTNRVNAPQMVGFVACLAAWYGKKTKDPRGVKFVIEQRTRPGDDCQLQLKLMGFNYHHVDVSYDGKQLNENAGFKQGWYTREYNRHLVFDRFIDAIKNGWYKPNSKWLINELATIERKTKATTGKSRIEHRSGKHDDRVISAAISYFSYHAFDVLADRSQKRYALPSVKKPDVDYSFANHAEMAVGDW